MCASVYCLDATIIFPTYSMLIPFCIVITVPSHADSFPLIGEVIITLCYKKTHAIRDLPVFAGIEQITSTVNTC